MCVGVRDYVFLWCLLMSGVSVCVILFLSVSSAVCIRLCGCVFVSICECLMSVLWVVCVSEWR